MTSDLLDQTKLHSSQWFLYLSSLQPKTELKITKS